LKGFLVILILFILHVVLQDVLGSLSKRWGRCRAFDRGRRERATLCKASKSSTAARSAEEGVMRRPWRPFGVG